MSGPCWRYGDICRQRVRMAEGFRGSPQVAPPAPGASGQDSRTQQRPVTRTAASFPPPGDAGGTQAFTAVPRACAWRGGPTPSHPEPGRETPQRGRYWGHWPWETTSVRPSTYQRGCLLE